MNVKVDEFINSHTAGKEEFKRLREIILQCDLEENFKWKHPCYTLNKKNVLLLFENKDHCGLSFFKGVLLQDKKKLFYIQSKNMQADRQLRFTDINQINSMEEVIRSYIEEGIEREIW